MKCCDLGERLENTDFYAIQNISIARSKGNACSPSSLIYSL